MTNNSSEFTKSDIGAQSAWKGFSSQTLYIASRIASDTNKYEFFPEDIEDLVVKKDGIVIEAVQVKTISEDLTLSSLASTRSSRSGEGFFKRVCKLHDLYPSFSTVRIIFFNTLGEEIRDLLNGNKAAKRSILKKLTDDHKIPLDYAEWLLSSWVFEKVNIDQLQDVIINQMKNFLPVMAAPKLAQSLLVQHISDLSRTKGSITFIQWQELIYQIGIDIAAIDGYYKEYQKSLIRLSDLSLDKNIEQLKQEFQQGISAHPAHIRNNLDFQRTVWLDKIAETINKDKAVIVKGVSGQGKSALCYRFLINHYPEQLVFCVRRVESTRQAENLAIALKGIAKHTSNIAVYIDVNPGEQQWLILIQELQARGVSVPVLVSIREEDFKMTRKDASSVSFEPVELSLSKQEAENIYEVFTSSSPHPQYRSFEEAWTRFGGDGPFIEFVYLLTNNQTLTQRLIAQIDNLLREGHPDSWFLFLQLVSFAGKTGCPLIFINLKQEVSCSNIFAASQRLSNEYLIRRSEDGEYVEALHPLRAQIICAILNERIGEDSTALMLSALKCIDSNYLQLFLMDYFSSHSYSPEIITKIATIDQKDWITCARLIKTMLWIDVKRYVQLNYQVINDLRMKYGSGWLPLMPLDASGLVRPDEFVLESIAESAEIFRNDDIKAEINRTRESLTFLHIDYEVTDLLIGNCTPPLNIPENDSEWSAFGYSLFWFAIRNKYLKIPFSLEQAIEGMLSGDIKSRADAILGMCEQNYFDYYSTSIKVLSARIVEEYCVLHFNVTDTEVQCRFVPPIFDSPESEKAPKNFNHYWKIKMVNILDQIYPDKEYIDVSLVGVDLFKDLGIKAHDHKAHIPKSNRYKPWITEINGWVKPRVDYSYRPDSWEKYVSQIDQIRITATQLISDTILFIDYLYKKQNFSTELLKILSVETSLLKELLFHEILLPKNVVDPYCLYSEGMNESEQNTDQVVYPKLGSSIDFYSNFRKSFGDTYRQLISFFDQCVEVLSARKNRLTLDGINNTFLSQYNLLHSAVALDTMQKEYNKLFLNYRTLDNCFENYETEGMLTLVNAWAYVTGNPVRGISITYDAKQLFRKSQAIIDGALKKVLTSLDGKAYTIEGKTYILVNGCEYKRLVLLLRDAFNKAHAYNSVRWYLETQLPELIYVPIYENVPLSNGFRIPAYRILDTNESQISSSVFPTELPVSISSILGINYEELSQWKLAMGYLGALKLQISQYNDAIDTITSSTSVSETGVVKYMNNIASHLTETINKISESLTLSLKALSNVEDKNIIEALGVIKSVLDDIQSVYEQISKLQKLEEFGPKIDNAVGLMLLLQPYVLEGAKSLKSPIV